MPIFMIVPTEDPKPLAERLTAVFGEKNLHILPEARAAFVAFDGTTQDVARKLDLTGPRNKTDGPCPAVISRVTTYGGFAPSSLWAWLGTRTVT